MKRILVLGLLAAFGLGAWSPAAADPADEPTNYEQYMLELVNRTRLDPAGEAARFGIDLNEGLPPGTLSADPREPLAMDLDVLRAARLHNEDLLANFKDLPPDHRGSDGKYPWDRVAAQNPNVIFTGENNSWSSSDSLSTKTVNRLHALLFKDFTGSFEVPGRGHRKVMLSDKPDMIGLGVDHGKFGGKKAGICTQDYVSSKQLRITGVAYTDTKTKDSFYTPGEGLGGVTVQAVRRGDGAVSTTTTWRSGGYNLVVEPGTWDVTASGGGLTAPLVVEGVVVTDRNVKVDFVPAKAGPPPPPPPEPVFALAKAAAKLSKKTGRWVLSVKKASFNHGSWTFTAEDLADLEVRVNGQSYFGAADRADAVVKTKTDKSGNIAKISIKTTDGNKLLLDLRKSRCKLVLKNAPGFDPTTGSVEIEIRLSGKRGVLATTAEIVGKKANKAVLAPAAGTIEDYR